jgi:hypothetical protein
MKSVRFLLVVGLICLLTSPFARAQNVRINEFMASNNNGLDDEDGDEEDWIEIYNPGPLVNLAGWSLTDTTNDMRKWVFPSVTLASNGYLIVFASSKDRNVGELHTNFRLDPDGEYLALVRPDGTVATEYSPEYRVQAPNISYGLRGFTGQEPLLEPGAPAKALVPPNADLEPPEPRDPQALRPWTMEELDDSAWKAGRTGVGYDNQPDYLPLLGLIVSEMFEVNGTVYIRVPFRVDNLSAITALTLRMRYEDGFIAYLNGRLVANDNAPDPGIARWTNNALANRDESAAITPRDFNISQFIALLHPGTNLLAIQGLNQAAGSSDLLMLPEIVATVTGSGTPTLRYFTLPTPGAENNAGVAELGPIVDNEEHHPAIPTDADDLRVTARIRPARGTVTSASLHYRTNFGPTVTIPFRDDGNSGDEGIGDGVYGAIIPANAHRPGQMVRWYITAVDSFNGNSRLPAFVEPTGAPEYLGAIVHDPTLANPAPVLYWFIQNFSDNNSALNTRCSLFFDGEFYDNVGINSHGQSSIGFPKKSYDIDFHPGYNFKWKEGEPRADDINLLTTFPDKAHMRNALAYETFRDADGAHHWVIPVRVQQNGAFWGTAHIVENGDEDWLVRMGVNAEGALYKMYNQFNATASTNIGFNNPFAEKKTRKHEGNADLSALYNGIHLTGEARRRFIYDNLDLAQTVNFLAGMIISGTTDCCHKNYYFYRDTGRSGEWSMWPWDVDLSFGRVWISAQSYWQTNLIPNTGLSVGNNNDLVIALFGTPEINQMYLRRIRTLMDELIKPPGTPPEGLHYEPRIDELAMLIGPDAALDAAKWNSHSWGNGSSFCSTCAQPFPEAVAEMRDSFLPQRRDYLYNLFSGSTYPPPQPPGTVINFGTIETNPSGGNQDQEYIQLRNPNTFAVDISGWVLSGGISFVFRGGTVIPASTNLYVVANRAAFRARTSGPRGNQSLHVVGDYTGRLSARGETLALYDKRGILVRSVNTPASPSAAQSSLRITEIMYHPPILPGDPFPQEEYEYIELRNIGTTELSLAGVHLSEGISFNFTGSSITTLGAGEKVLVAKNRDAFALRYGTAAAARIAGVYVGYLDNGGEDIRLDDATNEKILEFRYNNSWYPITDGRGFSLVIVNWNAPDTTWGMKESWRPSGLEYGSPGADDSALPPVPAILVNEVLANTDFPQLDAIELYNPTAADVDVTGWYITDDPGTPKKYRILTGTVPAGGYLVFDEEDFNPDPGTPPSFSFSSNGDEAYIYSGNAAGELTGYHHGYSFEASSLGVSFGRYTDSRSIEHFVAMSNLTLGGANSGPLVGPVVISEIHYHPARKLEGVAFVENFDDEYIELRNITGTAVPLFDESEPPNTWRLRGGVEFDFPPNITIPANGYILVVSFDPNNNPNATAAFRARHGLSPSLVLVGPFSGQLGNEGDEIRLRRPDFPDPISGAVASILVDAVNYDDAAPWPIHADGFGASLQRLALSGFGDDANNWTAVTITPGGAYAGAGGNTPAIADQPDSQRVGAGSSASFSVTATGDLPLRYQWTHNGNLLGGKTNATLTLANVQLNQAGDYQVVVINAVGSVASSNATLTVLIPARITGQPQSIQAHMEGTAIFTVQATSSTPITYQWRKNGAPLLGKTQPVLNISPVSQNDAGTYDVVVTDAVSSVISNPAQLTVLTYPVITSQPINQTVIGPINVTNTVVATSATRLRYQWYYNGVALAPTANIPAVTNASLIINNATTSYSGNYFVIVRDNYGAVTSVVARLTVNARAEYNEQPLNQEVPEGGIASFSAAWSGPGPFLHRWRRTAPTSTNWFFGPAGLASMPIANGYITASPTNTVLVFTNVTSALAGTYSLVLSNPVPPQMASSNATLTVIADTDRDGLPDTWESGRPNFSANDPDDALRDDDLDGLNNAREYFAGTDYLDTNSVLRTTIQAGGAVELTFRAVSNHNYVVQYTDDLYPGQWRNLVIEPGKTNSRPVTIIDPAPNPGRYYRLVTPAQR